MPYHTTPTYAHVVENRSGVVLISRVQVNSIFFLEKIVAQKKTYKVWTRRGEKIIQINYLPSFYF